jgi:hypothetical protein
MRIFSSRSDLVGDPVRHFVAALAWRRLVASFPEKKDAVSAVNGMKRVGSWLSGEGLISVDFGARTATKTTLQKKRNEQMTQRTWKAD